jgi:transposase
MKKGHNKITFKPYTMDQPALLPPDLEELIPADHMVRVVNRVMDGWRVPTISANCVWARPRWMRRRAIW